MSFHLSAIIGKLMLFIALFSSVFIRASLFRIAIFIFLFARVGIQGENQFSFLESEEFRHALLMDATVDKGDAAKIGKL